LKTAGYDTTGVAVIRGSRKTADSKVQNRILTERRKETADHRSKFSKSLQCEINLSVSRAAYCVP
jgi:hypothetical protein